MLCQRHGHGSRTLLYKHGVNMNVDTCAYVCSVVMCSGAVWCVLRVRELSAIITDKILIQLGGTHTQRDVVLKRVRATVNIADRRRA